MSSILEFLACHQSLLNIVNDAVDCSCVPIEHHTAAMLNDLYGVPKADLSVQAEMLWTGLVWTGLDWTEILPDSRPHHSLF